MQRAPARQGCEKMIVVLIVGLFATCICRQVDGGDGDSGSACIWQLSGC